MFRATMCPSSGTDDCVVLHSRVGMCCNNTWCYTDMSHCEWAVCGYVIILLQHIPTQGYNITRSSLSDDGHMVARKMLSN